MTPVSPGSPATALTRDDVLAIWRRPLLDLVFEAASLHRREHDPACIQRSALLSIKTGACPEDCGYCPQSAHHATGLDARPLSDLEEVVAAARRAKAAGADRFCMGAAWREVRDGRDFERVLGMVGAVKALGLETCATLGMLDEAQATRLARAGLDYYNHNLDTSPSYYGQVVHTRTYADRLETLRVVRGAGLKVCCGGIVGMGESDDDRVDLLLELARQDPQPESVPINTLVRVEGTPLAGAEEVSWDLVVRMVATARLLMPRAVVRLSAGRSQMTEEAQALCFLAGANSIFLGDRLLTTENPPPDEDLRFLARLGLASDGDTA